MVQEKFKKDILGKAIGILKEKTGIERVGIVHGNKGRIDREQDLYQQRTAGELSY